MELWGNKELPPRRPRDAVLVLGAPQWGMLWAGTKNGPSGPVLSCSTCHLDPTPEPSVFWCFGLSKALVSKPSLSLLMFWDPFLWIKPRSYLRCSKQALRNPFQILYWGAHTETSNVFISILIQPWWMSLHTNPRPLSSHLLSLYQD